MLEYNELSRLATERRENPALTGEEGSVPNFDFSRLFVKKAGIGAS